MKNAFPFLTVLAMFTGLAAVSGIHEQEEISPAILCEEVTVEVNRAQAQGIISQAEADQLISNCYSRL